jgi:hypothetical protein
MTATETLAAQLKEIFGERLRTIAAFGAEANTCAIVKTLTVGVLIDVRSSKRLPPRSRCPKSVVDRILGLPPSALE